MPASRIFSTQRARVEVTGDDGDDNVVAGNGEYTPNGGGWASPFVYTRWFPGNQNSPPTVPEGPTRSHWV